MHIGGFVVADHRTPSPCRHSGTARLPSIGDSDSWELVTRVQAGDTAAFGVLYDRHAATVHRFLWLRVRNRELAEDLTAETFLRALRFIGRVSFQGKDVTAWLLTIARNLLLDHARSAHVRRVAVVDPQLLLVDEAVPSSEQLALEAFERQWLHSVLDALPDRQRACVRLRFLVGLSVSETAQELGMTDGAVKALQLRALRGLARRIGSPAAIAA